MPRSERRDVGEVVRALGRGVVQRLRADVPRSIALTLLAITIIATQIPLAPGMPGPGLDDSWAFALNEALAKGHVFGRDLLFTFGPYSNVFSFSYHPATDGLMLLGSTYLAACYFVALVLITRGGWRALPWIGVPVFALVVNQRDAVLLTYPMLVSIVAYRIATRGDGVNRRDHIVLGFLASAFGLLSLVKGSMSIASALVAITIILLFALARRWRTVGVIVGAPSFALLAFWLLAGQPLTALPAYLLSFLPIVSHYGDAMSYPGDQLTIVLFLVGGALLLAAILLVRAVPWTQRLLFAAGTAAFLFVAFKAGFVRHDYHGLIPAQALVLGAMLVGTVLRTRVALVVACLCGLIAVRADHLYLGTDAERAWSRFRLPFERSLAGIEARLGGELEPLYSSVLASLKKDASVPILEGTTDVYSWFQTYIIASGNRWNPRPIMQSYAAYDPYLAERNREHLRGSRAPDNLLFRVETIDGRFPPLDDGASWPDILARYVPVRRENAWMHLRKRSEPVAVPEMKELWKGTRLIGRTYPVPETTGMVFARIEAQPTVLGKLLGTLFKTSTLSLRIEAADGQKREFRYVAQLGRAGFLLSPAVETTDDFTALYGPEEILRAKRVERFTLLATEGAWQWKRRVNVTFYELPWARALDQKQLFAALQRPIVSVIPGATVDGTLTSLQCDGVLDEVNGFRVLPDAMPTKGLLRVIGWATRTTAPPRVAKKIVITLTDQDGVHRVYPAEMEKRPDVAAWFKEPVLVDTGFRATIDVSDLEGIYMMGVAYEEDGRIDACSRFRYPLYVSRAL